MIVDHHFHLEEGPYSIDWLRRTAQALEYVAEQQAGFTANRNTLPWINELGDRLTRRMKQGAFTKEWLRYYLEIGKRRGVLRFGVVDHLYRFEEFRKYYENHMVLDDSELGQLQRYWLDRVCIGSIEPFIKLVRELRQEGEPIALGVEADYFPGGEKELRQLLGNDELDFVIGSVHFIDGWGFDNPQTQYRFETEDLTTLYRELFDHVIGAIQCGLFDIIAHPDNLKVFNYRPEEDAFAHVRGGRRCDEGG